MTNQGQHELFVANLHLGTGHQNKNELNILYSYICNHYFTDDVFFMITVVVVPVFGIVVIALVGV